LTHSSGDTALILSILQWLIPLTVVLLAARVVVLAYGRPAEFTLISLGQLWAMPSLLSYCFGKGGKSGVALNEFPILALAAPAIAVLLSLLLAYAIRKMTLSRRLIAATEAPRQYALTFGHHLSLALRVEIVALVSYGLAGVLLRCVTNDLSPDTFGTETLWCVIAVAITGRDWRISGAYLVGPLLVVALRWLTKTFVSATYASLVVYFLLASLLVLAASRARIVSRDVNS
jgi:hypothetical protein